jgi:hypothetical protein
MKMAPLPNLELKNRDKKDDTRKSWTGSLFDKI